MATPTLPTSPRARGWSESRPICVGRSNATERPVCPRLEQVVVALVATPRRCRSPAYCRIVQKRPRYIVGCTPRVNGILAGEAEPLVVVPASRRRRRRPARAACRCDGLEARAPLGRLLHGLAVGVLEPLRLVLSRASLPALSLRGEGVVAHDAHGHLLDHASLALASTALPLGDEQLDDLAGLGALQLVLHLHRLDDHQALPLASPRRRPSRAPSRPCPGMGAAMSACLPLDGERPAAPAHAQPPLVGHVQRVSASPRSRPARPPRARSSSHA